MNKCPNCGSEEIIQHPETDEFYAHGECETCEAVWILDPADEEYAESVGAAMAEYEPTPDDMPTEVSDQLGWYFRFG